MRDERKIAVPPALLRRLIERKVEVARAEGRLEGAMDAVQAQLGVPSGYTLDLATGQFKRDGDN
jgi:hypothetical protein